MCLQQLWFDTSTNRVEMCLQTHCFCAARDRCVDPLPFRANDLQAGPVVHEQRHERRAVDMAPSNRALELQELLLDLLAQLRRDAGHREVVRERSPQVRVVKLEDLILESASNLSKTAP